MTDILLIIAGSLCLLSIAALIILGMGCCVLAGRADDWARQMHRANQLIDQLNHTHGYQNIQPPNK